MGDISNDNDFQHPPSAYDTKQSPDNVTPQVTVDQKKANTIRAILNPKDDFYPGFSSVSSLDNAKSNPLWVENDIIDYELSKEAPWLFGLLYNDGGMLVIPLEIASFKGISEPGTINFFRTHKASGRIIPFRLAQSERPKAVHSSFTGGVVMDSIFPRFDPQLTPRIIDYLNQAQMVSAMEGFTKVMGQQLANPVLFGWGRNAIMSSTVRRSLLKAGVRSGVTTSAMTALISTVEALIIQVNQLQATTIQKLLEFARRLSGITMTTAQKARVLKQYAVRLGLDTGGLSTLTSGRMLLLAKDGKTALQIGLDGNIHF